MAVGRAMGSSRLFHKCSLAGLEFSNWRYRAPKSHDILMFVTVLFGHKSINLNSIGHGDVTAFFLTLLDLTVIQFSNI